MVLFAGININFSTLGKIQFGTLDLVLGPKAVRTVKGIFEPIVNVLKKLKWK